MLRSSYLQVLFMSPVGLSVVCLYGVAHDMKQTSANPRNVTHSRETTDRILPVAAEHINETLESFHHDAFIGMNQACPYRLGGRPETKIPMLLIRSIARLGRPMCLVEGLKRHDASRAASSTKIESRIEPKSRARSALTSGLGKRA